MKGRVLHLLSQRPWLTGSGVTLDAMIRCASPRGWEQAAAVGIPAAEEITDIGGLLSDRIFPLRFETPPLDYPLPGMSDVMPYPSSRFSALSSEQIAAYKNEWRRHLSSVLSSFSPDLIHTHHFWIMSMLNWKLS